MGESLIMQKFLIGDKVLVKSEEAGIPDFVATVVGAEYKHPKWFNPNAPINIIYTVAEFDKNDNCVGISDGYAQDGLTKV